MISQIYFDKNLHVSDIFPVHYQQFIHYTLSNVICHTGL